MIRTLHGRCWRASLRNKNTLRCFVAGRVVQHRPTGTRASLSAHSPRHIHLDSAFESHGNAHGRRTLSATSQATLSGDNNPTVDELEHLERQTHWLLGKLATGTMGGHTIQQALGAIEKWCHLDPKVGYALDSADRIFDRLVIEHSTGTYAARTQLNLETIVQVRQLLCESWLLMGIKEERALDRAEEHIARLLDLYGSGQSTTLPSELLEGLLQARLGHGTTESLRATSSILLWWTESNVTGDLEALLSPIFHEAVSQSVELGDRETSRALFDRMGWLSTECGWESLKPADDIVTKSLKIEQPKEVEDQTQSSADKEAAQNLSAFEIDALDRDFRRILETATSKERLKVGKLMHHIESAIIPPQTVSKELLEALVAYFVRIEDAKEATIWLRRLDFSSGEDTQFSNRVHHDVISLWAESTESHAPWRMQEIFDRLEELEIKSGSELISTDLYNLAIKCWSRCSDAIAPQKIRELFSKMVRSRKRGSDKASPDMDSWLLFLSHVPLNGTRADDVLSLVPETWTTMSKDDREVLLEKLLEALAKFGLGKQASELVRWAETFEIPISISSGKLMLMAICQSGDLSTLFDELEYLERRTDEPIPVEFYKRTLLSLLNETGRPVSYNEETKILRRALLLCFDQSQALAGDCDHAKEMMKAMVQRLKWRGKPREADSMLRQFEAETVLNGKCKNPDLHPPVSCYNYVVQAWAKEKKIERIKESLNRLLNYYRAGYEALLPNVPIFDAYLTLLPNEGSELEIVAESQRVLDEMIGLFQSSGNEDCKPDERIFNLVLLARNRAPSKEATDASLHLLDRMIALDVRPGIFTFNTIMQTVRKARLELEYSIMVTLADRLNDLELDPTPFTCTLILNSCSTAKASERGDALKRAIAVMGKLKDMEKADSRDLLVFAKTVAGLLGKDDIRREKLIRSTYRLCHTREGHLPTRVENEFRRILGSSRMPRDRANARQAASA